MKGHGREEVLRSMREAEERRARIARRLAKPPRDDAEAERRALEPIVGEKLSSVAFVLDYAELGFDGLTLRTFTMPHVTADGALYEFGVPGYRDALCGRIGALVMSAEVRPTDAIAIRLSDGAELTVSLRDADREGPESAMFQAEDPNELWIW